MTQLRSWLFARYWLALAVALAALAVRIVVPAGMMPGHGAGGATLIVCPGHAMPGMAMGKGGDGKSDPAKSDAPCAFTGLIAAALDAPVLPVLPALPVPVSVVAAVTLISVAGRTLRLWPPRRGPPARVAA